MSAKSSDLKQIAVSPANYLWLKSQGRAGDSFNDVITKLRQEKSEAGDLEGHQPPTAAPSSQGGNSQT